MQTLSQIKAALELRGLSPNRSLGQNFLCDHNLIKRLIEASGVESGDLVLEVGPGTGALTTALLDHGCVVIACELDAGLADLLRDDFADAIASGRFHLIEGDCLAGKHAINPALVGTVAGRQFTLIANLPYGAASPLMVALATERPEGGACRGQYVTIQKEVAQRLRAQRGTRDYSELSVVVQAMCEVRRIATLPPECFWPRPKVTSEMVAIEPRATPLTDDPKSLSAMCRRLFTKRRKQIGTILGRDTILPDGIEPTDRPEDLTIEQIVALASEERTK